MNSTPIKTSEILKLLWNRKTSEAASAVKARRLFLIESISEFKKELSDLDALMPTEQEVQEDLVGEEKPLNIASNAVSGHYTKGEVERLSPAGKRRRRRDVLAMARKLGQSRESFTTDELAARLQEAGYNLQVPEIRINTALGNMVARSEEFETISKGLYRLKREISFL